MSTRPLIAAVTLVLGGACYEDELASAAPDVASVAVIPPTATLSVNDTVRFRAELRDAGGAPVADRAVTWVVTNTAVIGVEEASGAELLVRARAAGSAFVRATSGGGKGEAGVTVR